MFSDDPQMTLIMRHSKDFSGVTGTLWPFQPRSGQEKLIGFYFADLPLMPQSDADLKSARCPLLVSFVFPPPCLTLNPKP